MNDTIILFEGRFLERTELEIYATSNFEKDVVDMLRILPDFSIPFQKFIPSYQYVKTCPCELISILSAIEFSHHFGYQCKVQNYGFSRLIDLLEELTEVVKVKRFIEF